MTKELNTLNLANAVVMRVETNHLNRILGVYEELQKQKDSDGKLDAVLAQIVKEKKRLSPCDKYDEEEVLVCRIVNRRNQNGRKK